MSQKVIRTKIKFEVSKSDGAVLVGYVTKDERNFIRGCRENDPVKKKIVIAHDNIAPGIIPNVLYDCTIIPMSTGAGYIATSADVYKFPAVIDTTVSNNRFKVEVKFGGKTVVYDPQFGIEDSRRTVEGALAVLEGRVDIKDKPQVINAFLRSANMVHSLYRDYRKHQL